MSADENNETDDPSAERQKKADHVDCRRLFALLDDYVDEQLPDEVRKAVDGHMHQCAPCLAFLKQYRFAPAAARGALLQAVPQDLEQRLLAFLRSRCGKK
jgi:anti-sigma factor RsiW